MLRKNIRILILYDIFVNTGTNTIIWTEYDYIRVKSSIFEFTHNRICLRKKNNHTHIRIRFFFHKIFVFVFVFILGTITDLWD